MKNNSLLELVKRIHEDEEGSISLETILIIGAIALPILIFLLTQAWPTIKNYFNTNLNDLQERRHQRRRDHGVVIGSTPYAVHGRAPGIDVDRRGDRLALGQDF